MNESVSFQIPGARGVPIFGDLSLPADGEKRPVVVLCHGFKGFKEHSFFPYLAESLVAMGYAVVRFNFSHTGVRDDSGWVEDLELFKENSPRFEAEDLQFVLNAVGSGVVAGFERIDPQRVGLIGYSRGGAAVIVVGAKEDRVKAIVGLASVAHPPQIPEEDERRWRAAGVNYVENRRTKQMLPLGIQVLESYLQEKETIVTAVRTMDKPLLIIHGDNDTSVPLDHARLLHAAAFRSTLTVIPNADHGFNMVHPAVELTEEFGVVLDAIGKFFEQHLSDSDGK